MKSKKAARALTALLALALVSCGNSSSSSAAALDFDVVCPKGAPGLALASYLSSADSSHVSISEPVNVIAAFTKGTAGAVIFDLTKGAAFITAKGAPYKIVSVLTKGNAYVVATGHDADGRIEEGDNIVSFGTGSIFTGIFKKIHGIDNVSEVADVATAYTVAVTGLSEGTPVDYVILSEPFVTKALSASSSLSVYENLSASWKSYSKAQDMNGGEGYDGFPQAGLFVSDALLAQADQTGVRSFIGQVAANAEDLADDGGAKTLSSISAAAASGAYDPSSVFGMDLATLETVVDGTKNPMGISNALAFNAADYDVNGFLGEAAISGFSPISESAFSSYYTA